MYLYLRTKEILKDSVVSGDEISFLLCFVALTISDASFSNRKSSWMSFEPFNIRHKVHIWMQFQTFSGNGILFYTAQHLSSRSGKAFILLSCDKGGRPNEILSDLINVP